MKNKKEATPDRKISDTKKPVTSNALSELGNAVIGLIVVSGMAAVLIWIMRVLL